MHQNRTYKHIKDLLVAGKFRTVFKQLPALLPINAPVASDLIILEGQYLANVRDEQRDTVSREEIQQTYNRISQALLTILTNLEAQEIIPAEGSSTALKDVLNDIRELLKDYDCLPHALSRLELLIEDQFPEELPLLTPLWANFNTSRDDYMISQTIDREAYMLNVGNVVKSLVELLLKLEGTDEQARGPQVQFGSELAVVNCNRKKILLRFQQAFEEKENTCQPGHIYLLNHQQYGQSESLVRRLVTTLKQQYPGVKYNGFHQINIQRIDIEASDSIEDCQFKLRKGFNQGLRPEVRTLSELLGKVHQDYPQFSRAIYLPFVIRLKMPLSCWEAVGQTGLRWFVDEFSHLPLRGKQIPLLFIILDLVQEAPKPASKFSLRSLFQANDTTKVPALDVHEELTSATANTSVPCTVLPPLMRISKEDLLDWYQMFEDNEREREEKVQEMVNQLGNSPDGWHMSDVELLLKNIVEEHQNAAANI